jgi:Restriction endonuclease BglII
MKIGAKYSHLNGLEWLLYHHRDTWEEVTSAIENVDAHSAKTKKSEEKSMYGRDLYSPDNLNTQFRQELWGRGWQRPGRVSFYATDDETLTEQLIRLPLKEQKDLLKAHGKRLIASYNEADFEKNRIALEVQFGKYAFVQFDIFIKHAANYMRGQIDLGIEIVPMKSMEDDMSSGPPYYEKHLHEIKRQGRIFPPVPLILIGVEP